MNIRCMNTWNIKHMVHECMMYECGVILDDIAHACMYACMYVHQIDIYLFDDLFDARAGGNESCVNIMHELLTMFLVCAYSGLTRL